MNFKKEPAAKSYSPSVWRVAVGSILALLLFLAPLSASAYEILLGTGEVGSFSYFSGRMLCRTISRQLDDTTCTVLAADNDIDSITNLQSGSLDLAIINSNVLDAAVNKSGRFQFLDINYENLAILSPLYDRPLGILVRSNAGIATLNDLKGKRVNGGAPGSIERRAMELIMKAKGWSADDFARFEELPTSHSQDTMAFCHGTVQAMIMVGVHPSQTTQRLVENCKAVLLDIDDADIDKLVESRAPCWKTEISATSYSESARTFGTRAILVASSAIDKETGYAITKVLYENKVRLQNSHPALSLYPVQEALKGIEGLQLHEGAKQFFTEE
jgi:TRAP transporter TAXI family solute receptor